MGEIVLWQAEWNLPIVVCATSLIPPQPAHMFWSHLASVPSPQVPELAGFWLLTLLQTPLVVFVMANTNTTILPLDTAINIPLLAFLLAELCLGFRALQLMIGAQAVKFYLSQFAPPDGVEMRSR